MKKGGLHEDHVGFPGDRVGNDADGEMSIQKRPSLLRSSITVVVGVAVVVRIIDRAGIGVVIAITSRAGVAIDLAIRIDGHHGVADTPALRIIAFAHFDGVQTVISVTLAIGDQKIVGRLARIIVQLDSGVEQ